MAARAAALLASRRRCLLTLAVGICASLWKVSVIRDRGAREEEAESLAEDAEVEEGARAPSAEVHERRI